MVLWAIAIAICGLWLRSCQIEARESNKKLLAQQKLVDDSRNPKEYARITQRTWTRLPFVHGSEWRAFAVNLTVPGIPYDLSADAGAHYQQFVSAGPHDPDRPGFKGQIGNAIWIRISDPSTDYPSPPSEATVRYYYK